ncbi:MAG: M23 family metallopeptidase [Treponema sp.]|nr:M23 family metallopeptidase [Treponema sp.]
MNHRRPGKATGIAQKAGSSRGISAGAGISGAPAGSGRLVPRKRLASRKALRNGAAKKEKPPRAPWSLRHFLFGSEGLFPMPLFDWQPDYRPLTGPDSGIPAAGTLGTAISAAGIPAAGIPAEIAGAGPRAGGSGFPIMPLVVTALTIVISVLAINWKQPVVQSLLSGDSFYLGAAGREEEGRNLASYAGLYSPDIPADEEAIPLDLGETFRWNEYKVVRGDTLSEIAAARQLDMGTLIASNGITNARRLQEGEILRIPNMDGIPYTVKAGDSLSGIATASSVPLQVILDVNDLESDVISPGLNLFLPGARMPQEEVRMAMGESFIYPVRGVLSSPYGWRIDPIANVERFHSALDLAAPQGTPVKASLDGRVSRVAVNSAYGNYIILTHQGGYQTLYAHLSVVSIRQGDWVSQNSKIGEVGSTGYSTGPHLHFSVFRNNKAINPLEVLQR